MSQQPSQEAINSSHTAIRLQAVTLRRAGRIVLEDVDLTLEPGRITAIMGPSGSGKTSLLKLITGQISPDAGRVSIGESCVHELNARKLNQLRRNVGVLLQNGALFTDLTCFDNVALPLREHTDLSASLIRRLVLVKLQAVGLRGAAELYPRSLSGGMNRRVALARALALDPAIMLYDEPFAGLDPISLGTSLRLIRDMNQILGITSIVTTHDVDEVHRFAHYCYIIAGHKVAAQGTPEELRNTDSKIVRQFMNGLPDGPVAFHYPAPPLEEALLAQG